MTCGGKRVRVCPPPPRTKQARRSAGAAELFEGTDEGELLLEGEEPSDKGEQSAERRRSLLWPWALPARRGKIPVRWSSEFETWREAKC